VKSNENMFLLWD